MESLERELLKYLLKFGHRHFELKEGKAYVKMNVAAEILHDLEIDNIEFSDNVNNEILLLYRKLWNECGEGAEIPVSNFTNHNNPEVSNVSVDLLMSDDNYVASEIWTKKDIHIESDEEILAVGVPKAMTLYKSKIIERYVFELSQRLNAPDISEEEVMELTQKIAHLNGIKVSMSKKTQRSIL